jgi:maleate isomerase
MTRHRRIGLIVPSSNTTMETELPELFRRRERVAPERFSFHSARMPMTEVTPEALAAMDREAARCAADLADAACDVMAYACVVAIMVAGPGAHRRAEQRLSHTASPDGSVRVVTSAGALAEGIRRLGVTRVAVIAPYLPPLTQQVVDYLGDLGIHVVDRISLGVADNRAVGRLDPLALLDLLPKLELCRAEALVLSACVQMPSLPVIAAAEELTGLPVLSAATATAFQLLETLGLDPMIEGAGTLLGGCGGVSDAGHSSPVSTGIGTGQSHRI